MSYPYDFSWALSLWKGVRDSLEAAAPLALAGLGVAFFDAVTAEDLVTYNVPAFLVPALIGVFATLRNVLRNKVGLKV